jgi:hypothetical protein
MDYEDPTDEGVITIFTNGLPMWQRDFLNELKCRSMPADNISCYTRPTSTTGCSPQPLP